MKAVGEALGRGDGRPSDRVLRLESNGKGMPLRQFPDPVVFQRPHSDHELFLFSHTSTSGVAQPSLKSPKFSGDRGFSLVFGTESNPRLKLNSKGLDYGITPSPNLLSSAAKAASVVFSSCAKTILNESSVQVESGEIQIAIYMRGYLFSPLFRTGNPGKRKNIHDCLHCSSSGTH
ncbi:uncharacterized protein DS421_9g273320 [Arachis hypogaea]|nr:uncharacterized protein DS421_9g273320 [Arachis hypogaea]